MNALRAYQQELSEKAAVILNNYGMAYLAMEVRTGKTLTALNTAHIYGSKRVLFLTKKKAIPSIQKDYENFGFEFELFVTNYEQLGKFSFVPDLLILDEAHCLGAFPKPSQRVQKLASRVGKLPIIYLSGTPTPEGYSQIFHQLWISAHSPYSGYKNFYRWADVYVNKKTVRRGMYEVTDYSNADGDRIKDEISHLMLTYTQEEAQFDCPVTEFFHEVSNDHLSFLMKKLFKDRVLYFENLKAVADTPASLLSKLHQISGGSVICDNGTQIICEDKAIYIKETFKEKRIVIFYKYIGEKKIIEKYFPMATESPEEFQNKRSDVFISQICSGREGITLSTADCIVMYSIDYASVSYWQSRARIQTLNRNTPAEIHWIFIKNSVEKRIYKMVQEKKDFTLKYFIDYCIDK